MEGLGPGEKPIHSHVAATERGPHGPAVGLLETGHPGCGGRGAGALT